jgi:hypothetical protein
MGFIPKLHPKTASLTSAHFDLAACIQEAIDKADDNTLLELGITNDKIEVTLASDRLRGVFRNDKITSNGVVVFSEPSFLEKNYTLLEHFSEGMWASAMFSFPSASNVNNPRCMANTSLSKTCFSKTITTSPSVELVRKSSIMNQTLTPKTPLQHQIPSGDRSPPSQESIESI